MSTRTCPACGAPRGPDSAPSCGCARRIADASQERRSAEAAAAEDFDPLRIRPYVSLPDTEEPAEGEPETGPARKSGGTERGREREQEGERERGPAREPEAPPRPAPAASIRHLPALSVLPVTVPKPALRPPAPAPPVFRHPRKALLAAGTTVAAAAAAAAVLFTPGSAEDRALPEHRPAAPFTAAPEPSRAAPSPSPARSALSRPSSATSPAAPTRTVAQAAPPPSRTPRPPTAAATGTVGTTDPSRRPEPPVLRQGDSGPEVRELQQRLKQLYLYGGETDGRFDVMVRDAVLRYQYARQVEDDERGVYGRETRRSLEADTEEP